MVFYTFLFFFPSQKFVFSLVLYYFLILIVNQWNQHLALKNLFIMGLQSKIMLVGV